MALFYNFEMKLVRDPKTTKVRANMALYQRLLPLVLGLFEGMVCIGILFVGEREGDIPIKLAFKIWMTSLQNDVYILILYIKIYFIDLVDILN